MAKAKCEPRKSAQGQREASDHGSGAERTSRELLANLRHELRTPLNAIVGYSEMLLEDARELREEVFVLDLGRIHSAGTQILEHIKKILDPSKADTTQIDPDFETIQDDLRHQLRTPLKAVIGSSEMLIEKAEAQGLEDFASDLRKIHSAAERFLAFINDIANFSTTEAGVQDADLETAGASSMAEQVARTIEPRVDEDTAVFETGGGSLLVVDDNEDNRNLLSRHLERQGHTVRVAENGRQALDVIEKHRFDLVLLDIMMPEMNGLQVLQHLKSRYIWKHIPVIMLSALDDMDTLVQCIEMGAEDYLHKPFDSVLLRARIGACLDKKRLHEKELSYLAQIKEVLERLNGELARAADYVESLLPAPITEGSVRTDWRFVPSTSLGGDSLGYHWLDDEHFAIYLLDVSGHGVGAALLSVSVINVLRSQSLPATDFRQPAQVFSALNNTFPMELHNNMFFTIWYGVYNRSSRKLAYASAGHPPALLFAGGPSAEDQIIELQTKNLFIGGLPDLTFKNGMYDLQGPGRLYVFSDGVYEITKEDGEIWDFEEFVAFMVRTTVKNQTGMDSLLSYAHELSGTETFDDDFSILEVIFE